MADRKISQRSQRIIILEPPSFPDGAAHEIALATERAIRERGHCDLSLAGGSTPRPVYAALVQRGFAQRLPWDRIDVFFGDERCVPPDDRRSNYRMAREALLDFVPIPTTSVHRMRGEQRDHDVAAREYERSLPARLDVLLLGMGDDGHTVSLFPGSSALAERERRVVRVAAPAGPPRLTITPPVIEAARQVIVLVAGAAKATILSRVLRGPSESDELPIQLALDGTWVIDSEAASGLRVEQ